MNIQKQLKTTAIAGLISFIGAAASGEDITLATASTGGSYYPVGVQLSTIVTEALGGKGVRMSPITTGGSAENVDLIRTGEAQMAVMMGLYGRDGYTATGTREGRPKVENLRSVAALWQNVEQYIIRSDKVETGDLSDLASLGTQFSIGPRNSGTEGTSRLVMAAVGIDPETAFSVTNMKYGAAAEAFQNGRIDGMSATAGVPTPAVAQAFVTSGDEVAVLNVTDAQLDQINAAAGGLFTRIVIPAGTYEGQTLDVATIQQPNFLAASADLSDEAVYQVTRVMFGELTRLQEANKAAAAIRLETALNGLPVPLHPGALRFYEEQGFDIPDRLRP
jgi:TRAP transporter TAXI family solute receptor